jgi:hypothetical protein
MTVKQDPDSKRELAWSDVAEALERPGGTRAEGEQHQRPDQDSFEA